MSLRGASWETSGGRGIPWERGRADVPILCEWLVSGGWFRWSCLPQHSLDGPWVPRESVVLCGCLAERRTHSQESWSKYLPLTMLDRRRAKRRPPATETRGDAPGRPAPLSRGRS